METQNDPKTESQITKLDNELSSSKKHITLLKNELKMQSRLVHEAEKRIKYYQEDNLRLSSEQVTLSKRLDNTKHQLVSYESNKQQIMSEIKNLNNVISQSNIINNKFGSTILESDKIIINNDGKITKKVDQKIKNTDDINLLVKEIFKK